MHCECGSENAASANFCRKCGRKLRAVCDCWVKKQPHDCGRETCPGMRLYLEELSRETQGALENGASELDQELAQGLGGEGAEGLESFPDPNGGKLGPGRL